MPGQTVDTQAALVRVTILQWRAGQLPGQTSSATPSTPSSHTFNGGPDNCPARPVVVVPARVNGPQPSMEGRTIARPDVVGVQFAGERLTLQWRGRTIARPDSRISTPAATAIVSFNGGPDNCPARRGVLCGGHWHDPIPSMEGRTIARPDPTMRTG